MKKLSLIIIAIIISSNIFAQKIFPSAEKITQFYKTNTSFVLDNNILGEWNGNIQEEADNHWKINKHNYISPEKFKKAMQDENRSFVVQTYSYLDDHKDYGTFETLSLVLGTKNASKVGKMTTITDFPIAYKDADPETYHYKIGIALMFMQNHVKWLKNNPDVKDKKVMDYYRKAKGHTKDKVLYALKSDLPKGFNTTAKLKKIYSGKVKITTSEEIKKAIDEKDENVLILHIVKPERENNGYLCLKMVLGASDAKLYYFDYHKIKRSKKPGAFLKSDFKAINKQ